MHAARAAWSGHLHHGLAMPAMGDYMLVIVQEGRILHDRLGWVNVDEEDILEAAHLQHGLMRLEQIRYAIIERNGAIAIVPWSS